MGDINDMARPANRVLSPSRDWRRLYNGLCSIRPDGKLDNEDLQFDLILTGFIESREVTKPCRNCGTSLVDYRYIRITEAGRMFMEVCAQAIEARSGETRQRLEPKDESAVGATDAPTQSGQE